ncbi:MAG TPA: zf-TFIIB domain-containing protein [Candidatus Kapabacteria bacterium]|nr:zf-TFIIB domain-containing protein [Candidatus Kapabacteria bacterium]
MNCPACKTVQLVVIEREGVEIDYCPNCRGVWLERNELETIIKRANEDRMAPAQPAQPNYPPPQSTPPYMGDRYDDRRRYDDDDYKKHHGGHYKKKKGGFLEDLFDF